MASILQSASLPPLSKVLLEGGGGGNLWRFSAILITFETDHFFFLTICSGNLC